MPSTVTITDDAIMTALRTFLLGCVPNGVEVFQSQDNRVPMPAAANFIIMTPSGRERMSTNNDTYLIASAPDHMSRGHSTAMVVQLDIYGPAGADYAQIIATLFRDDYACQLMDAAGIAPLFATDGQQMPLVTAEKQYLDRWTMKVTLGGSPIVSTPQNFAATLTATVNSV
jgi:hypothetical protein